MSAWDDFLSKLNTGAKAIENVGMSALGGIIGLPTAVAKSTIQSGVQIGTAPILNKMNLSEEARKGVAENIEFNVKSKSQSSDPLLKAAMLAVEKAFRPFGRVLATPALLSDFDSPLFEDGQYGEGFQLNDIKTAYNRSKEVSPFQAIAKSSFTPIGALSEIVLKAGKIDLKEVNLWDDESIKTDFSDNVVGRWYTGFGDFFTFNYGLKGAVTVAAKGSLYAAKGAGISTKGKTSAQFEKEIDEGLLYNATGGAEGKFRTSAIDVEEIAKSTDSNYIFERASKYSNNEALSDLLLKTTNPQTVRDFLLADKGYVPAFERLSKAEPDGLWELADMNAYLQSLRASGKNLNFDDVSMEKMNKAFDAAIEKDITFKQIRDAFLDPTGKAKVAGNDFYFPIEPVVGAKIAGRGLTYSTKLKAATVTRDFSQMGGYTQIVLGGSLRGPITYGLRLFGTRKPMGMVTFSGARPLDGTYELDSYFDNITAFRNGSNFIKTSSTTKMKASEYRTYWKQQFLAAKNSGERFKLLEQFDKTFSRDMARTYGYYDIGKIDDFIAEIRGQLVPFHTTLGQKGYGIDGNGSRVIVNAVTQRQFAESFRLTPWDVLEHYLIRDKKTNIVAKGASLGKENIKGLFEIGNKYWTIDVLGRPSYIPKNSIFEPILSATLSQGISFITDNAGTAAKNAIFNTKQRALQAASKLYKGPELKAVNKTVNGLLDNLNNGYQLLDEVNAEYALYFTDELSPVTKAQNLPRVKSDLKKAREIVESIENQLGDALRPLGFETPDMPSITNLEARIKFLETTKSGETASAPLFPNLADYKDGGSGGLIGSRSVVGFVKVEALKDMPGNKTGNIELYRKSLREGKGFGSRERDGKPVQEPIMVIYNNETGLAFVGEGNHRLQAAIAEGISYVPVRVVRGTKAEVENIFSGDGRKPKQIKNNKEPQFVETTGADVGKPVQQGYVPPEFHPSYIFDSKFIVEQDSIISRSPRAIAAGAAIANAKAAVGTAKGSITSFATDLKTIQEINLKIELAYKEINDIIKSLGEARYQQALVFEKSAAFKKRKYGKEDTSYYMYNGQYVPIESLFDENLFGLAYRQELANSKTTEINFLGQIRTGVKQKLFSNSRPNKATRINEPNYFEELAWVANRTIRKDPLMDKILTGLSEKELIEWAVNNPRYVESFGVITDSMLPTFIRERMDIVRNYFPDEQARALILEKEVTSVELQKILAPKQNILHPIHPNDFNYLDQRIPSIRGVGSIDKMIERASGAIWKKLTAPENPIRWAYADDYFRKTVNRKADLLAKQGVPIDLKQINALRQAAARETVLETEKVFYTVRRQNRALFAARAATAFPTASLNAVYRYGRMAIKHPDRAGGFLYSYHGLYNSFGVDQYGNPTENPLDATHIVVPGTADMKIFGDQGIRLGAKGVGFLLNYPSPSVWTSLLVGNIMRKKPDREEQIINIIGEEAYNTLFPFGPQTDLNAAAFPTWARDLYIGISSPENNAMWINSYKSHWDMAMAKYEMKLAPAPTEDSVAADTRRSFLTKGSLGFASPFGVPPKVETKPDQIFKDYYNILVNKYIRKEKMNYEDATAAAEREIQATIPSLPVDRLRFSSNTLIPSLFAQQEVYDRIWKQNPELVKKLVLEQDASIVGLLALDVERDPKKFSLATYKFLTNQKSKLPGNIQLNTFKLTPEQLEVELEVERTWKKYIAFRDDLTSEALTRFNKTSLRQVPALQNALKFYANTTLKRESKAWWTRTNTAAGTTDNSFKQAQALSVIIGDEKFMKQNGNSPLWRDVTEFLQKRQETAILYSLYTGKRKSLIKDNYLLEVDKKLKTFHPNLQDLIKRYFEEDTLKAVG